MFEDFDADAEFEAEMAANGAPLNPVQTWRETCKKCNGTGRYYRTTRHGRDCFACKGAGYFERRTSPEARAKAKARGTARKAQARAATIAEAVAWCEAHPAAVEWIRSRKARFEFARSMDEALDKFGHLTERQLATVERLAAADAERDAARTAEREARLAAAPVVSVERIETALRKAASAGLQRIVLRLASFRFSPAPSTGRNAGAVYVKSTGGEYLGKIQGGRFARAFACDEVTEAEVVRVASDPEAAAVAYGRRFGQCACCGRELSNPESVERGIGPICAEKFGW